MWLFKIRGNECKDGCRSPIIIRIKLYENKVKYKKIYVYI